MGIPLANYEIRLKILNLYRSLVLAEGGQADGPLLEHFSYYGQYSGFYVFKFEGWSWGFGPREEYIDGLNFSRPGLHEIYALKEGFKGTLEEAYDEGYLKRSELEKIHEIHVELLRSYYKLCPEFLPQMFPDLFP